MSADQDCQISTRNIEDQLAIIAVVLIDGAGISIKGGENRANHINGDVSDGVQLIISQRFTRFKMRRQLGILTRITLKHILGRLDFLRLQGLYDLFCHNNSNCKVPYK